MKLSSLALASIVTIMLPSIASAQLADGGYPLTDTLNSVNGNATAATLPGSGIRTLKVEYHPGGDRNTTTTVNLSWSSTWQWYVDNGESPTKRFRWVTVRGVRYYWYETINNSTDVPSWDTKSSGTF